MIVDIVSFVITGFFLLVVLSYYVLLFKPHRPLKSLKAFKSLTIIVPAHNEEPFIAKCLESVLAASFRGRKEVIVVADGCVDRTAEIARKFPVKVLEQKHMGKSASINRALKLSKSDLVAIVDGDSYLHKDSLLQAVPFLAAEKVAVVCSVVRVFNRRSLLGMWLHIEQLYNSLVRSLFVKLNVNIVTPGPLSIYKRSILNKMGGFSTKGFSEDVDIAVRLIKEGYAVEYAPKSFSDTNMPISARGFWRQRTRFARGWINIFKKHLQMNRTLIDIYTLPLALFWYVQAVIMGSITIVQMVSGYLTYFVSEGVYFSFDVLKFFFEWLSVVGLSKWAWSLFSGDTPLTLLAGVSLAASLLSYPLYFFAIAVYDRRFDLWHLIPLFFMFPFWLLIMVVYILMLPEYLRKDQRNIWHK